MTKVSIIIACLNASKKLVVTIESILSQNYYDLEIIIIDGKSTDNTLETLSNYKDNIAILDTHILKFIRENIDNRAPKSTPTNSNTYKYWEDKFLLWCTENKKNTAEFDLEVWKSYARKNKEVSESE